MLCFFFFLEGKVEKVTPEVIIVIVLGFATAIITEKDIRGEFKFTMVSVSSECFRSCCCLIVSALWIYYSLYSYMHVILVCVMCGFFVLQKHGVFASKYHKRHVIKKGTMLRFSVKR